MLCPGCGDAMKISRITAQCDGMSELETYECRSCDLVRHRLVDVEHDGLEDQALRQNPSRPRPAMQPQSHPRLQAVLVALKSLQNACRRALDPGVGEFGSCHADDIARIACDLGTTASELRILVRKGPDAAQELYHLLDALHLDPEPLRSADPVIMRDLQRSCIVCRDKKRCRHDLAAGIAAEQFRDYCLNAKLLESLRKDEFAAV